MKSGRNFFFVQLTLVAILSTLSGIDIQAQNPIPSYNVLINTQGTFIESFSNGSVTEGKRKVFISGSSVAETTTSDCHATVYVATVDQQTILGPFTLVCGVTLEVEIDDRQWAVLVVSDSTIFISVWIVEEQMAASESNRLFTEDKDAIRWCDPEISEFIVTGERQMTLCFIYQTISEFCNYEKCFPHDYYWNNHFLCPGS